MSEHARKVVTTQRLARQQLDTESVFFNAWKCWHPVPHYGGGGGSRYYGASYSQCNRTGVWIVTDDVDDKGRATRYCAQHARKHGFVTADGPIEGVRRV